MTSKAELLELAERCEKAAEAYGRIVSTSMPDKATALAAGLVLSLHGHLFAPAAAALRAQAEMTGEG